MGLGNIGAEYENTRHNIGFDVVDFLANQNNASWKLDSSGLHLQRSNTKRSTLVLIKPTTYMNLSGKAIHFWMQKHKIPKEKHHGGGRRV